MFKCSYIYTWNDSYMSCLSFPHISYTYLAEDRENFYVKCVEHLFMYTENVYTMACHTHMAYLIPLIVLMEQVLCTSTRASELWETLMYTTDKRTDVSWTIVHVHRKRVHNGMMPHSYGLPHCFALVEHGTGSTIAIIGFANGLTHLAHNY